MKTRTTPAPPVLLTCPICQAEFTRSRPSVPQTYCSRVCLEGRGRHERSVRDFAVNAKAEGLPPRCICGGDMVKGQYRAWKHCSPACLKQRQESVTFWLFARFGLRA